jgi:bidirectional [NiFe] hydrogenase diaphorase subunit
MAGAGQTRQSVRVPPATSRSPVEELLLRGGDLPDAAQYGARTYFADHRVEHGERHVRVCAGTGCFAATGGRHVGEVEAEVGVGIGECASDGSVSLQAVHCLGYCYAGPAALMNDEPLTGRSMVDQLAGRAEPVDPEVPAVAVSAPVVLRGIVGGQAPWQVWPSLAVSKNGGEQVLAEVGLAGLACRARAGFVYVRSEYPAARASLERAVDAARRAGHLGTDVHGSGVDFDVEVVAGHGSYVAGEETSLLRSMAGLRGTVRVRPPFPTRHGLLGRPTAVNNVETLAAVPAILADGGAAYARLGQAPETGTLLVCLSERFARPGVYEVELGTSLRMLVEELGGGLKDGAALRALQVGGPLGGFLGPSQLDLPLLESALAAAGVSLGHGSLVAIDAGVSRQSLLAHLWRFGASETCGACTPCREGTRRGAADPARASDDDALLDLMSQASLCAFGRRLPAAVRSLKAVPSWS